MGDVIHVRFGADRKADQAAAWIMEAMKADLDAAGIPAAQRAVYRAAAKGLFDQSANAISTLDIRLTLPPGAPPEYGDQLEAEVIAAIETLYLRMCEVAVSHFRVAVLAACDPKSPPDPGSAG